MTTTKLEFANIVIITWRAHRSPTQADGMPLFDHRWTDPVHGKDQSVQRHLFDTDPVLILEAWVRNGEPIVDGMVSFSMDWLHGEREDRVARDRIQAQPQDEKADLG